MTETIHDEMRKGGDPPGNSEKHYCPAWIPPLKKGRLKNFVGTRNEIFVFDFSEGMKATKLEKEVKE